MVPCLCPHGLRLEGKRFLELGKEDELHPELESLDGGDLDPGLPSTEDVILKTEQVTKNIQELLRAAQEFKHDSFVPCSEKIHLAVTEMASLFPKVQGPQSSRVGRPWGRAMAGAPPWQGWR